MKVKYDEEMTSKIIDFLNELVELDKKWVEELIKFRPFCNEKIAHHPTVIVGYEKEFSADGTTFIKKKDQKEMESVRFRGGLLGLLNGLVLNESATGPISSVYDDTTGELVKFILNEKARKCTEDEK